MCQKKKKKKLSVKNKRFSLRTKYEMNVKNSPRNFLFNDDFPSNRPSIKTDGTQRENENHEGRINEK